MAGAFAAWYWRRDKKKRIKGGLSKSLHRALTYHLGSIAFASLLIAIVNWIRIVLQYIKKRAKLAKSKAMKQMLRAMDCCLACFDRFLKFINRNAYIEIAIYGESFCAAAKRAVNLLFRNALRVAAVNTVGDSLLFLGKVFIAIATGLSVGCIIYFTTDYAEFWFLPMIISIITGFVFGSMFMSVYEIGIDTILLCFCEDVERHDGSPARPFFMSNRLRRYVNRSEMQ